MADEHPRCPHLDHCQLVRELKTQGTLEFCRDLYCHANFGGCARHYHIEVKGTAPPADLLPNGRRLHEAAS